VSYQFDRGMIIFIALTDTYREKRYFSGNAYQINNR